MKDSDNKQTAKLKTYITHETVENAYGHIIKHHGRPEKVPIYLSYDVYKKMMKKEKYRKLFGGKKNE